MAKHRMTEETPDEYRVKNVMRRVIDSYTEFHQHSKQEQWRQNMLYALFTHLENAKSPSHRRFPLNQSYENSVRFMVYKNRVPDGWEKDNWHSYMHTLAGHDI